MTPNTALPFPVEWLIPLLIWESVWKALGLWHSARNNHIYWFAAIFILNSAGLLPIIYLVIHQWRRKRHETPAT